MEATRLLGLPGAHRTQDCFRTPLGAFKHIIVPKPNDPVPKLPKFASVTSVPRYVGLNLFEPEAPMDLQLPLERSDIASMPERSIHEHGHFNPYEEDIGPPG
jgi:hypothetical protein